MDTLRLVLFALHAVALVSVLVGLALQLRGETRHINGWMAHGATTQLVTGLLLVGVIEAGDDAVNYAKIVVKLLVAVAVVGIAHSQRSKTPVASVFLWALLALEAVNVAVAVAW